MYIIGHPLLAIVNILSGIITVYSFVVLAAVVLSFVSPDPHNPIVRIIRMLTEPAFTKVRPYMPKVGMLDLSALAVILALQFIQMGILPVIQRVAIGLLN